MGEMQDWFPLSDTQEDADLDGEPVTRVTGKLDLSEALTDLKELASEPGMSGAEGSSSSPRATSSASSACSATRSSRSTSAATTASCAGSSPH